MHQTSQRQRWIVVFAIAVAVHLLVVLPVLYLLIFRIGGAVEPAAVESPPIRPYELVLEPDEEDDQDEQNRQVVSVDQPESERPDEARFDDRVNRTVDEETRARERGQAVPTPPARAEPPPRPRARPEERRQREARAEEPEDAAAAPELPEEQPIDEEIAAVFDPTERGAEPARRERPSEPDELDDPNRRDREESEPRLDLAAFSPSFESARDFVAVPGAPSPDHLDLPQGERDQINSIENMYWSYWDRIKRQVRPHWRPTTVYRERDPTGRVFGVEDRYTVLRVTLNGDGSLRHVYLERSSDLDFLDREAIRAVRAAEPFSNVPEGLKDDRGLLSFRFGFYFEVNSSNFRIRREDW